MLTLSAQSFALAGQTEPTGTQSQSPFERDRQAILAMAGEFAVKFNFIETVAMAPDYTPHAPYATDARELVFVLEDRGDFISLQHLLVVSDPADDSTANQADGWKEDVVKHWRQDWTYQDTVVYEFSGRDKWDRKIIPAAEAAGTWTQAVYQVDDSPRYESYGKWTHIANRSVWESGETWRPLPRRERARKGEYDVLVARNRHTITPQGWVQEEDNYKMQLAEDGTPRQVLVHEAGLNSYTRLPDHPLTAAREYWRRTGPFWGYVREEWSRLITGTSEFAFSEAPSRHEVIDSVFTLAQTFGEDLHCDPIAARKQVGEYFRTIGTGMTRVDGTVSSQPAEPPTSVAINQRNR